MHTARQWLVDVMQDAWWRVWVDAALKATVLLILAWLVTLAVRRSSAALRHRIWCLTFSGLIVVPFLSHSLPQWRVPIFPAPTAATAQPPAVIASEARGDEITRNSNVMSKHADSRPGELEMLLQMEREASRLRLNGQTDANSRTAVPFSGENEALQADLQHETSGAASVPAAPANVFPVPPAALPVVWLGGIALVLLPMALGLLRLLALHAGSGRVTDASWVALLDDLRGRLSITRRVRLLETRQTLIPMTWGVLSPVVLLPERARLWTSRLRRFVLLHELAHVKRFDVAFQMLARVACAMYWFHPLAWYALRRLRIEREMACDDCVVTAGEQPADYAEELLEIARSHQHAGLTPAVAMAVKGSLEHRVRALFDRT